MIWYSACLYVHLIETFNLPVMHTSLLQYLVPDRVLFSTCCMRRGLVIHCYCFHFGSYSGRIVKPQDVKKQPPNNTLNLMGVHNLF